MRRVSTVATVCFFFFVAAGCAATKSKDEQFQQFAKDWSKAIRSQQVIPIYPLVENLRVGDVFLVDRPIENEAEQFYTKGYLPLGRYIAQVPGIDDHPRPWPKAAFATFSFDLRRGGSLGAGIPVQGVPVSFSLLGSDAATATVSLKDASVYRVPDEQIDAKLTTWGAAHKDMLQDYRPAYVRDADGDYRMRYNYIRVITGIYRIKKATVVLNDATSLGGKARIGVAENLGLLVAGKKPSADVNALTKAVNDSLKQPTTAPSADTSADGNGTSTHPTTDVVAAAAAQTPELPTAGVQLSAYAVTATGVTLNETFDKDMVIGYVAIDVPIGYDGRLGTHPTETRQRLAHGGGIHTLHLVHEFMEDNPNGEWLVQQWFKANKEADKDRKARGEPESLGGINTFSQLKSRLYSGGRRMLGLLSDHSTHQLALRVLSEVVEQPEGLEYVRGEAKPTVRVNPFKVEQFQNVPTKAD